MRIVYSREFLLSIRYSDLCKNLPHGFDVSLLSELQKVTDTVLDWSKSSFVTPMERSDGSGGYSYSWRCGSSGRRWDARSTRSSDQEGDLTDRDMLTQDRRNRNQYKHSWQNTKHDGLMGSVGFPRPSGYTGQLASKDHGSTPQANKTSKRYQPPVPRPCKAGPLSRKDLDSLNDETFGSFECLNEDRAEEERKRRASFEMMRKEQHKSLQEKKTCPDTEKGNPGEDLMSVLQNSSEKTGATTKRGKPDGFVVSSVYQEDTAKISAVLPASTARPLIPPGFSNAFVERKVQSQSSNISLKPKAHIASSEDKMLSIAQFGGQLGRNPSATEIFGSKDNEEGISDNITSDDTSSTEFSSSILEGAEDWEADEMDMYSIDRQGESKNSGSVMNYNMTSMLEDLLNAVKNGDFILPPDIMSLQLDTDDNIMVPFVPEPYELTPLFHDEGPSVSDGTVQNLSSSPTDKLDASLKLLSFASPAPAGIPELAPVMMTCEDLEQTMVAQVASNSSSTQKNTVKGHEAFLDEPDTTQKEAVDNHASHPLLSLLTKGADNKGSSPFSIHKESADQSYSSNVNVMANGEISGNAPINTTETIPASGKSMTLETLFGAAFMNELHSKDAPVSNRGSASSHEGYYPGEQALTFKNNEDGAVPKERGTGMEYRNSSLTGPSQGSASFDKNGLGIHLPEEDNVFTMNDFFGARKPDILLSARSSRVDMLQSLVVPGDVGHVPVLSPDGLGSRSCEQRYQVESRNPYHHLQGRSPTVAPHLMMDHFGNRNMQALFDMSQATRHDTQRSFPTNMNPMQHTLNPPGVPYLDSAAHPHILQRMPEGFPPEGLARGVPPSQPVHHVTGYRPEMTNVNNFLMHPHQPNYRESGLMPPGPSGPEVRGTYREAFARLMQMELTARSKEMHPARSGSVPGGMHGPGLDINLRYSR